MVGLPDGSTTAISWRKRNPASSPPCPWEASEAAPSEEEQLRFYLRTERHREMYAEEILALRQKSRALETLYQQEMGKVHARTYSQHLRDIGLSGVWFAILEGVTIASGRTRQEVDQAVRRIVPKRQAAVCLHLSGERARRIVGARGRQALHEAVGSRDGHDVLGCRSEAIGSRRVRL